MVRRKSGTHVAVGKKVTVETGDSWVAEEAYLQRQVSFLKGSV